MIIKDIQIFHYDLPLLRAVKVGKRVINSREGFILKVTANEGSSGFGEIAPLPGISKETLEESARQIFGVRPYLMNQSFPSHIIHLKGAFENWLKEWRLKSSVRFGLEMALLNLVAASKKIPLPRLFSRYCHEVIPLNGLLKGSREEILAQAQGMIANGFRSLKIKVGEDSVPEDINRVLALSAITGNQALLRLDANQAWSVEEAIHFGQAVGCAAVEYIEEPFAEIERIPEFYNETTIPVALDESLKEINFPKMKSLSGIEVFVLKPTVLGGIERTWQLMQKAHAQGIQTTISSSYETGIGLTMLADLTASQRTMIPAGLDTLKYFQEDLLSQPRNGLKGLWHTQPEVLKDQDVNIRLLTEIPTYPPL